MVFRLIRTARDKENNLGPKKDFVKLNIYHISKIDTHNAFDIDVPSCTKDACHSGLHVTQACMPCFTVQSLWFSGKASERGNQRSEVRFLTVTQNSILSQVRAKNNKTAALQATADHSKDAPEINKIYNSVRTIHEKISITCKHKRLQHLLVAMLKCHATPPMVVIGQHSRETLHSGLHGLHYFAKRNETKPGEIEQN